jgi:ubiquitin-activating enzyme E1 C
MDNLLLRTSKKAEPDFIPGEDLKQLMSENAQVLVVGAGGLGCEILKNLALFGIKNIFVIDLDTIELSNLNRQFLFRQKDIGGFKAEVASNFIKNKFEGINIKWSKNKIQDFAPEFFKAFHVIIGGLDNMEARRWINEMVHDLVEFDAYGNPQLETVIPFIDGGTEGFRGQSRVIQAYKNACLDCTAQLHTNRNVYALCTIAETPRLPEHCIEYIYLVKWKEVWKEKQLDKDSVDDVSWIFEESKKRAESFGIEGVTYQLTLGVIKNVIPAIASTNAIVAASTCLEAIKCLSFASKILENNIMYMGHEGIYASTTAYEKNENCKVCTVRVEKLSVKHYDTLQSLVDTLIGKYHLENPIIFTNLVDYLYIHTPGDVRNQHLYKLEKTINHLIADKELNDKKYLRIHDGEKVRKVKLIIE